MKIHGFNKTTLLDYPGTLAAVIFLGACNFRCPWCHNYGLVVTPHLEPEIPLDNIFSFLKKRQGILEGVCITGGEPTLHSSLRELIVRIRELGYKIKLDTNGYRPDVLRELLAEQLLDYIAMDIKADPTHYAEVSGLKDLNPHVIDTSIHTIMESGIDYEFRTTVVKELHSPSQFQKIGQWIAGCRAYYLQPYRDSENTICDGWSSYPMDKLEEIRQLLQQYMPVVEIRGTE